MKAITVLVFVLAFEAGAEVKKYQKPCAPGENGSYSREVLSLDLSTEPAAYSLEVQSFGDSRCLSEPYFVGTSVGNIHFLGLNRLGQMKTNVTAERYFAQATSPYVAQQMSTTKYCGYESWQSHVPVNMTGRRCGLRVLRPRTDYTISLIEGKTLELGRPTLLNGGQSEATRHTRYGDVWQLVE